MATTTPSKKTAAAFGSPSNKVKPQVEVWSPSRGDRLLVRAAKKEGLLSPDEEVKSPRALRAINRSAVKEKLAGEEANTKPTAHTLDALAEADVAAVLLKENNKKPSTKVAAVVKKPALKVDDSNVFGRKDAVPMLAKTEELPFVFGRPVSVTLGETEAPNKEHKSAGQRNAFVFGSPPMVVNLIDDEGNQDPAKKAARAFDSFAVDGKVAVGDIHKAMEETGEGYFGEERDEQVALMDPSDGFVSKEHFIRWYVDLVNGDDESFSSDESEPANENKENDLTGVETNMDGVAQITSWMDNMLNIAPFPPTASKAPTPRKVTRGNTLHEVVEE